MSLEEPTDLVCRSRRGPLAPEEERRLAELRAASPEARLVEGILEQLEAESCVRPGDDAIVARIAASAATATAGRGPDRRRRRWSLGLLAALASLLAVGAAGAWGAGLVARGARAPAAASVVASGAAAARAGAHGRAVTGGPAASSSAAGLAAPASSAAPSEMLTLPAPAAPAAASSAGAAAPRATTPAALLVAANLARRQGRTGEARELYRVIVERHPAAREAPVARLALAKLLAPATPAAALAEFEALATSGGALRAEGLWGQAECARRLGRAAVERRALEALLREYPASAYADAARERIAHGGR